VSEGRLATVQRSVRRHSWPYLLILPSLLLMAAVVIYPIASGVLLSFRDVHLNRPELGQPFVGLRHYLDFLTDPVAWTAIRNTLVYVVVGNVAQFVIGLGAALVLDMRFRGVWLARLLVALPLFLPSIVVAYMWGLLLDFRVGVINDAAVKLGVLHAPLPFLADPSTALASVMVVELWRQVPWYALFLLAGLQAIPHELYEASAVDGAGPWSRFRHITLPMLKPVIIATTVLQAISLANNPDLLVILTGGGPGNTTQVLSLYAFNLAYREFNFGYAATVAVIIFMALLSFTLVYVRASGTFKDDA
jgi:multiple sugar transport system permease protein